MKATGYAYSEPKGGFAIREYELGDPAANQVIVKVAGCGLCHTDVGFYNGDVAPRHALPLVLGHEISGTVVAAGADATAMIGQKVVVPAVIPCGECEICQAGHEPSCPNQFMPGNDGQGGFADYVKVPARGLAVLPADTDETTLASMSVIADAVTTPLQSMLRADVGAGDFCVVIGAGGIGTHGVQIAAALGATVIAVDIDDAKLAALGDFGAAGTVNVKGLEGRDAKNAVKAKAKEVGAKGYGWKIFEMSGSAAGQELAYSLVNAAATLAVVGFTMAKINLRLSNLMAFDARCFGNWGCTPEHYPRAVEMVLTDKIALEPFVEHYPLSEINELFEMAHHGKLRKRAVLRPS